MWLGGTRYRDFIEVSNLLFWKSIPRLLVQFVKSIFYLCEVSEFTASLFLLNYFVSRAFLDLCPTLHYCTRFNIHSERFLWISFLWISNAKLKTLALFQKLPDFSCSHRKAWINSADCSLGHLSPFAAMSLFEEF